MFWTNQEILQLKNNQPISFSLELTEKDGNVFGYSITNQNTEDETKSEVQGLYFKKDKTFQLQETQIITTKSEVSKFSSYHACASTNVIVS